METHINKSCTDRCKPESGFETKTFSLKIQSNLLESNLKLWVILDRIRWSIKCRVSHISSYQKRESFFFLNWEWKNKEKRKIQWPLQRRQMSDKHSVLLAHVSHYVLLFFWLSCEKWKDISRQRGFSRRQKPHWREWNEGIECFWSSTSSLFISNVSLLILLQPRRHQSPERVAENRYRGGQGWKQLLSTRGQAVGRRVRTFMLQKHALRETQNADDQNLRAFEPSFPKWSLLPCISLKGSESW